MFTAEMVKPLRERMDMTQQEFAVAVDCGIRSVSKWENGKVKTIGRRHRRAMERMYNYQEAKS